MIDENLIKINLICESQDEVFHYLATLVVDNGYANNTESVVQALKLRESEGPTGMMEGFAIPHAKDKSIVKPSIAILKLKTGVEWHSMDGQLINNVIALFIPEKESGTTHLKVLSQIARLLVNKTFKEKIKEADTILELKELLTEKLDLTS
ncbi:PTS sugar transporter subunit IIA [Streptococcus mutans]|jgi:PTS system, fructose subfamily, IIA component|uniref:PTS sugar transporter subunit IIA n=1 Tax=Streptococcus mutans TaxID=1309 RepID=UPI0002B5212A|nr:fructose PTS transporter subunit IIA [Streptococcus mutans]EMC08276.1 putative PTS system, fructose-specific IIA component [Streptococcus mutans NLML5]NLQ33187.1 PTS fructose transporter subunit IIA [Streptococcus mutans]